MTKLQNGDLSQHQGDGGGASFLKCLKTMHDLIVDWVAHYKIWTCDKCRSVTNLENMIRWTPFSAGENPGNTCHTELIA